MRCIKITKADASLKEAIKSIIFEYNKIAERTAKESASCHIPDHNSDTIFVFSEKAPNDFFDNFINTFGINPDDVSDIETEITWCIAGGSEEKPFLSKILLNAYDYEKINFYQDYETACNAFSQIKKIETNKMNAFVLIRLLKAFCNPENEFEATILSEDIYAVYSSLNRLNAIKT